MLEADFAADRPIGHTLVTADDCEAIGQDTWRRLKLECTEQAAAWLAKRLLAAYPHKGAEQPSEIYGGQIKMLFKAYPQAVGEVVVDPLRVPFDFLPSVKKLRDALEAEHARLHAVLHMVSRHNKERERLRLAAEENNRIEVSKGDAERRKAFIDSLLKAPAFP